MLKQSIVIVLGLVVPLAAFAEPRRFESREELMELLGSFAMTEDFEGYPIPDHSYQNLNLTLLDETTTLFGAGPNLVRSEVEYTSQRAPITWMGGGYNGIPSRSIVAWNPAFVAHQDRRHDADEASDPQLFFSLQLTYRVPVNAFGIDLHRFDVVGLVTIEMFDAQGFQINELDTPIPDQGPAAFVGYYHPQGIGTVIIKNTRFPTYYSPNIDNHTYGFVAPVPARESSWGRIKNLFR